LAARAEHSPDAAARCESNKHDKFAASSTATEQAHKANHGLMPVRRMSIRVRVVRRVDVTVFLSCPD